MDLESGRLFWYTIQEGENLQSISNKFNINVKYIQLLNNLNNYENILPGQVF